MSDITARKDLPLVRQAKLHHDRTAFQSGSGSFKYRDVLKHSALTASALLQDSKDLAEARIAFLVPPGYEYVATQWGIWRAGGIAVPLSCAAVTAEIETLLQDADVDRVVVSERLKSTVREACATTDVPLIPFAGNALSGSPSQLPEISPDRRAMILYTSGTTNKPKGVVSTHAAIAAQIESLITAWHWSAEDSIPLFLPLHHVHGIINVLSCALWSGAVVEPFSKFDIDCIFKRVAEGAYSVFMAVPTIYVKMIQHLESMDESRREPIVDGFSRMRLMVSGSAALPASVHETWKELTHQSILERYGMTEIGMALSNPYDGDRRPGTAGQPLPGIQVRLKSESGEEVVTAGAPGEIQVRGRSVFREYWRLPEVTASCFDDSWFKTGDVAVMEDGYYRIMGRQSVDIIKSGGYKLSALEIESELWNHPSVRECCVVGVPDEIWGEAVAVAAVAMPGCRLDLQELSRWCENRLSKYKLPRRLKVVDALPRNAMGKVIKPSVLKMFV